MAVERLVEMTTESLMAADRAALMLPEKEVDCTVAVERLVDIMTESLTALLSAEEALSEAESAIDLASESVPPLPPAACAIHDPSARKICAAEMLAEVGPGTRPFRSREKMRGGWVIVPPAIVDWG
jgi:hypothetical protein